MYQQTQQNYPNYYSQAAGIYAQKPSIPAAQQMVMPTATIGLKGRPVSSLDEVRATTIDFDGSVFFFPDLANKKIYTKQINLDGTSSLNMYELKNLPMEQGGNFVTRQEFETTLLEIKELLNSIQMPQNQTQVNTNSNNLSGQQNNAPVQQEGFVFQ